MDKYLLDGHKLFWHLDRVYQWQKDPVICPIYMEVSPVSFCNNRCIFCGIDFARGKNEKLNIENYIKFIKKIGKFGLKSAMFAGEGEPLLHPEIDILINETINAGIDVALVTNGNNADKELMNKFLDKLTWLRFSVDAGSEQIYSNVHGAKLGAFSKVIKNIENCVKIKMQEKLKVTIGIQYVVIDKNFNDIENALKIFSNLNVDYISIKPFSLHPQMKNKIDVDYTFNNIYEIEKLVEKYKRKINIIFRKDSFVRYINKEKNYSHCFALPFWGHLTAKGELYTCSVFLGDERFLAGNINYDTVKQILFGEKRKKSIYFAFNELDIRKECRVNCRMARINEFLNSLKNPPEHINFI